MNSDLPEGIGIEAFQQLLLGESPIQILDVRTPYEIAELPLKGMATEPVAIPLEDIFTKIPELQILRNQRIIVVCGLGLQSHAAVKILRKRGFLLAQNLEGGLEGLLGSQWLSW